MDDAGKEENCAGIISGFYDAMAEKYADIAKTANYAMPQWLNSRLETVAVEKPYVLDLGCANGYLGAYVKRKIPGSSIVGVDISVKMIEELRKTGTYQETVLWDLAKGLPFIREGAFDMMLAIGFLEFIAEPASLFAGMAQSLKPAGQCFASFEVFDDKKDASKIAENAKAGFPRYLYDMSDIEALVKSSGLRIVSYEKLTAYVSPVTGESREYFAVSLGKAGIV